MATTDLTKWEPMAHRLPSAASPKRATAARRSMTSVLAESRLQASPYLSLRNIVCDFHEGLLILRGCLPTYYLKQQAQTAVAHVDGVGQVVNLIEVCPPGIRRGND